MNAPDPWQAELLAIERAARKLRSLAEAMSELGGLERALAELSASIPVDVRERPQHPLRLAADELDGTLRQVIRGYALQGADEPPAWLRLLESELGLALDDFDRALALLMKAGVEGN